MQAAFETYLTDNLQIDNKDTILLAVSGGIDSMVMLHLFARTSIPVTVAHCNFQLRGQDAVQDEIFVAEKTRNLKIPLHSIRFETKEYARQNRISIQMAARELRYKWFKELCLEHNYTAIATAHHSDDVVETFLLNLLRKTGIGGLHGIKPRSGLLIRPMLFADKEQITSYAKQHEISYREDVSNTDDHYQRNYIRRHILPEFKKIKSDFNETLLNSIDIIAGQEKIYKEHIRQITKTFLMQTPHGFVIDIQQLNTLSPLDIYLFEMLHPLGFNKTQTDYIIGCLLSKEEKLFVSASHRLLKTRNTLNLYPAQKTKIATSAIARPDAELFALNGIKMEIKEHTSGFSFDADPAIAYFDLDKVSFPLHIRTWTKGDYFYPFAGKGRKKLSDFFSDMKLNSIEKQTTRLLCNSDGNIIWVMGLRSDNRYKVSASTQSILICRLAF
ncbi:MAG: tRNA lysidine(34) synthetase TilS [Bacteroidales bacterium]|jgi:tRNA(Ile)-lysidine synthase|nr:tRNA lysidine(34) synthetase TilS [Bacteroidales bacterium]